MKKFLSILICIILSIATISINVHATNEETIPEVIIFTLTDNGNNTFVDETETRATGLITSYGMGIAKSGTTLKIEGATYCVGDVVKSGFKNLVVERRKTSSDSWTEYYDFGNVYRDTSSSYFYTELTVASGYQYRVTCKHYAKKSLLITQTVSNTSNIVTVS